MSDFYFKPGKVYGYDGTHNVERRQHVIILHTWDEGRRPSSIVLTANGEIETFRPSEERRIEL